MSLFCKRFRSFEINDYCSNYFKIHFKEHNIEFQYRTSKLFRCNFKIRFYSVQMVLKMVVPMVPNFEKTSFDRYNL